MQTDGLTPHQRLNGKPYSGELAEFGEQVYVKDPISRHAELDGRWIGPVTWIGKADRGDQQMTQMDAPWSSTGRYVGFLCVNDGRLRP